MSNERKKHCMEETIPELKKQGVTITEISEELDYRERAGIVEARQGWDDRMYFYSTEELEDAEVLWDKAA